MSTATRHRSRTLTIIDAIEDDELFRPFFGDDEDALKSWRRWMVFLRAVWGLPIKSEFGRKLVKECTGRDAAKLNPKGFGTVLCLCGRRSGKSRIAGVIAGYLGALAGLESKLDAGERGMIAVVSPSRLQGRIVRNYIRAIYDSPMLNAEVIKERSEDAFQLKNGNRIEILASDYRSVRGYTLLGVVVDEIAFMGLAESSKIRTDYQIVRSLEPALATTGGKLIAISSPYGKTGWAYDTFKRHFGNDRSRDVLVWNAPSRLMNPTLPQSVIDRALAEDLAAAKSEYLAEFRDDICAFVSLELLQNLVIKGRHENIRMPGNQYMAFVDLSGGRNDASALCIAHRDGKNKVVIDVLDWHPSPNNPFAVVGVMAERLKEWGIGRVTGDNFSADFASQAFKDKGVSYSPCDKNKSALYAELLPVLSSGNIELLDNERMVKQLASLERRTRAGGKDVIDHPQKAHDDLANAVAGVCYITSTRRARIGSGGF